MNIDFKIQEYKWTQQIKKEYEKYKIFINDTNVPNYKPNFIYDQNVSYFMCAHLYRNPIILNVNGATMLAYGEHCQPTLFHEFTHMWDSQNIFLNQTQPDRIRSISLYTEYHASQIQFLKFMEFNSIFDNKTVKGTDLFWWLDNKCTAYQFYKDHCGLLQESTQKYINEPTMNRFKVVIDSYLYLFGIKNIYDNLFDTIDIPQNNCIFHNEMTKLYQILQEYEVEYLSGILCETQKLLESIHNNYVKHG